MIIIFLFRKHFLWPYKRKVLRNQPLAAGYHENFEKRRIYYAPDIISTCHTNVYADNNIMFRSFSGEPAAPCKLGWETFFDDRYDDLSFLSNVTQ